MRYNNTTIDNKFMKNKQKIELIGGIILVLVVCVGFYFWQRSLEEIDLVEEVSNMGMEANIILSGDDQSDIEKQKAELLKQINQKLKEIEETKKQPQKGQS